MRAKIAGDKTVTRRPFKQIAGAHSKSCGWRFECPYGPPGTILRVQEPWQTWAEHDKRKPSELAPDTKIQYTTSYDGWKSKIRPPKHMPIWACRYTDTIVSVQAERPQDITNEDANSENAWVKNPFVWVLKMKMEPIN